MSNTLILYGKAECELCDRAELLIAPLLQGSSWTLEKVDIESDEWLLERYGWRIPVLQRGGSDVEIDWPFPASRVRALMESSGG